jgi:uncharacterized membrane protein
MKFYRKICSYILDNFETIKHYYLPVILGIMGVLATVLLIIFGDKEFKTVFLALACLIMSVITVFYYHNKVKQKNLLTNLSLNFLLDDEFRFDYLLNFMIGRKPNKMSINDSTDILFDRVENFRKRGDAEMNRRITEALPVFYYLSRQKYWILVENLREDFDPFKWKSDNRRRVIESFEYIINHVGYEKRIFTHLVPKLNDEIFTHIASIEILAKMDISFGKRTRVKKLIDHYLDVITKSEKLTSESKKLLRKEWNLLSLVNRNITKAKRNFEDFANSGDLYEQIIAARNFRLLCNGSKNCFIKEECKSHDPNISINFINKFLTEDKHKYVRRPLSKENSLECLVLLLQRHGFENIAKGIIWKLFKDNDDIIRITTFDKIYRIKEIDSEFADEIINYLDNNEKNEKLKNRIASMKKYKHDFIPSN